jgi:hypothetical protein
MDKLLSERALKGEIVHKVINSPTITDATDEIYTLVQSQKLAHADMVIGEKGTRLSKIGNTLCDELIDEQRGRNKVDETL